MEKNIKRERKVHEKKEWREGEKRMGQREGERKSEKKQKMGDGRESKGVEEEWREMVKEKEECQINYWEDLNAKQI